MHYIRYLQGLVYFPDHVDVFVVDICLCGFLNRGWKCPAEFVRHFLWCTKRRKWLAITSHVMLWAAPGCPVKCFTITSHSPYCAWITHGSLLNWSDDTVDVMQADGAISAERGRWPVNANTQGIRGKHDGILTKIPDILYTYLYFWEK